MDLAPRHPEKVLMVKREFARRAEREHTALIAALIESCAFCDKPENRERLIETLAEPHYVGVPIQALRMGMGGTFDYGHGRTEKQSRFHVFAADGANEPSPEMAAWVIDNLLNSRVVTDPTLLPRERAGQWFRADIYQQALELTDTTHS
jgi:ABC-type nitrate/sulfonate/bicarbonate transport system substrate-binding protein